MLARVLKNDEVIGELLLIGWLFGISLADTDARQLAQRLSQG